MKAMESTKFSFAGPSCGHHASYTFYKAIKYTKNGKTKILSLGEFFFVKIFSESDIVSIGELQLLWEDKNTNQILSSLRLYFLPEYTPEGRLHYHGEDEMVAVSEKAVLRVSDLLNWIAAPNEVEWNRGLKGISQEDCVQNEEMDSKFTPGHADFLTDVRQEKIALGDVASPDELGVIILSLSQYGRYRSVLKRIAGVEKKWMQSSLIVALGGFTTATRRTFVLFCREHFDYPELEEHPYLCNHLAPKLKGRPRKKKNTTKRAGSPESESASSESSVSTSNSVSKISGSSKNGVKKDLLSILRQKNTRDELEFLKKLTSFMERRNTPIERPPMLGFKQIDLHLFYEKVNRLGGYEGCVSKKSWKAVYDDLGGNPQNTSAATCTRRHYEKFLLPYERYLKGGGQGEKRMSSNHKSSESLEDVNRRERSSSPVVNEVKSEEKPSSPDPRIEDEEEEEEEEVLGDAAPLTPVVEEEEEEDEEEGRDSRTKEEIEAQEGGEAQEVERGRREGCVEEEEEVEEETERDLTTRNNKDSMDDIIPDVTITKQTLPKPSDSPSMSQSASLLENKRTSESPQMRIDPEGKRLQIDDLIIIPNNLNAGHPEGGSALQNLAKIASRYQNPSGKKPGDLTFDEGSTLPLKRPRLSSDDGKPPSAQQPLAATNKKLPANALNPAAAASLFSMLPPGLIPPWSNKQSASSSSANSPSKSLLPGLADAMKLGPDGYHLLQFYENQMKNAAAALASTSGNTSRGPEALLQFYEKELKNATQSFNKINGGSSGARSETPKSVTPVTPSASNKDRIKVCKPPPDTKRPPSLMQTPCAFVQTTNIYTNPLSELTQAREAATKSRQQQQRSSPAPQSGFGVLDLTASKYPKAPSQGGILNLKTEKSLIDLTVKKEGGVPPFNVKNETKANPFSTEALLSKPTKHPDLAKVSPSLSVRSGLTMQMSRLSSPELSYRNSKPPSPATPPVSKSPLIRSSNYPASSPSPAVPTSVDGNKRSPWHTPVGSSRNNSPVTTGRGDKPAIPVTPVVRENKKTSNPSDFASSLMGLANSFMPQGGGSANNSPGLPSNMPQMNPYLALMASTAGGMPPVSKAQSSSPSGGNNPGAHPPSGFPPGAPLMDPATSAYYAALYSQQMFGAAGLNPFAGLGTNPSNPGAIRPAFPPMSSAPTPVVNHSSGLDPLQASALQAMMARNSAAAAAAAAAANPYNAANYAGLTTGLHGFLGFPPPPSSSRKDP